MRNFGSTSATAAAAAAAAAKRRQPPGGAAVALAPMPPADTRLPSAADLLAFLAGIGIPGEVARKLFPYHLDSKAARKKKGPRAEERAELLQQLVSVQLTFQQELSVDAAAAGKLLAAAVCMPDTPFHGSFAAIHGNKMDRGWWLGSVRDRTAKLVQKYGTSAAGQLILQAPYLLNYRHEDAVRVVGRSQHMWRTVRMCQLRENVPVVGNFAATVVGTYMIVQHGLKDLD
ncbi:hypothetical protein ABPG75_003465 [Micractinium tetrahymenae]